MFRIHRALGRWSRGDDEDDDARAASLEATKAAAERRDEMRFLEALPSAERYRREWVEFTVFFDWLVSNFAAPGGAGSSAPPPLPSGAAEDSGGAADLDAGRTLVLPAPRTRSRLLAMCSSRLLRKSSSGDFNMQVAQRNLVARAVEDARHKASAEVRERALDRAGIKRAVAAVWDGE